MAVEKPFFVIVAGTTGMEHKDFLDRMGSSLAKRYKGSSLIHTSEWGPPPIGVDLRAGALMEDISLNKGDADLIVMIAMSAGGPLALYLRENVMDTPTQDMTRLALVCARTTPNHPTDDNERSFNRSPDYRTLVGLSPAIVEGLSGVSRKRIVTFSSPGDLLAPPDTVRIPGALVNEVLPDPLGHQEAMGMFLRYRNLLDQLVRSP